MPRTLTLNTPKKVFKVGVLEPPLLRLKTPTFNTELYVGARRASYFAAPLASVRGLR